MTREWTREERLFYEPWYAQLRDAFATKSPRAQGRVMDRFFAACRERDGERALIRAQVVAIAQRAEHAARMRAFRARQREAAQKPERTGVTHG